MPSSPASPMLLPLDSNAADWAIAGGKAAHLSRLARAGFAVPRGFIVTTRAYDVFVTCNGLGSAISAALGPAQADDPASLETASASVRARFNSGLLPEELAEALNDAYAALSSPPVAVRSSATAEDLPGLSFAGQHDTYLQILGSAALRQAVVNCWSSLWTARAIGYRFRNGISEQALSMGVLVQEMVRSEVSGVLFTAHPLNGKRSVSVINASYGLGEALVSGQVEPDQYTVNNRNRLISEKKIGAKALSIHAKPGGGTRTVVEDTGQGQALPDAAIVELALLGARAADLFGGPQDLEWAWSDEKFWVLQARPITALFPTPEGVPPEPLRVFLSVGSVQGMLDPMTPLGRDVFLALANARGLAAVLLVTAGERLFVDLTGLLQYRLLQRFIPLGLPGFGPLFESLRSESQIAKRGGALNWWKITRQVLPVGGHVLYRFFQSLIRPHAARAQVQRQIEQALVEIERRAAAASTLAQRLKLFQAALDLTLKTIIKHVAGVMYLAGVSLYLIHRLTRDDPASRVGMLELTRGLPHNVTTEMDLRLWAAAAEIKTDPESAQRFQEARGEALAADYLVARLPNVAQAALADFMCAYGMRGIAEIDLGRPRWREEPAALMQVLKSYLRIEVAHRAPDAVFAHGADVAKAAAGRLAESARKGPLGWLKARVVKIAARRIRALAGLRESPKFFMIRTFGILREGLLDSGRNLAAAGVLDRPQDIFFLHREELRALDAGEKKDGRSVIAGRRGIQERERRRRQIPSVLLSDGRAFYAGTGAHAEAGPNVLAGEAVSPGVVEGKVRVVFDPHATSLEPGEILVCPGTDPAWTPLFLAAGGLVTEVGGLVTHGSVVAREYGIPAVVGVFQATLRLKNGQRVSVDGTNGHIVILS